MQVRDPTVRFSGVVADRRRSRSATCGEWFRLGDHAPDLGRPRAPLEGAVIGASARALTEEHLDQTVAIIGVVGGLLADLGFRVSAAGTEGQLRRLALIVWVGGDETRPDEHERLDAMGVPGLWLGPGVAGLGGWASVEPGDPDRRDDFLRSVVDEIGRLLWRDRVDDNTVARIELTKPVIADR